MSNRQWQYFINREKKEATTGFPGPCSNCEREGGKRTKCASGREPHGHSTDSPEGRRANIMKTQRVIAVTSPTTEVALRKNEVYFNIGLNVSHEKKSRQTRAPAIKTDYTTVRSRRSECSSQGGKT